MVVTLKLVSKDYMKIKEKGCTTYLFVDPSWKRKYVEKKQLSATSCVLVTERCVKMKNTSEKVTLRLT